MNRQPVTLKCLRQYDHALRTLRVSLDDPVLAQSDASLCAVMVLMVCQLSQDLMGTQNEIATGHCEGAAQLLKARQNHWPAGIIGHKLSLSVCTAVLIESFYNPRIKFSEAELRSFSSLLRTGTGAAGTVLSSICDSYMHMSIWESRCDDISGVFALPIKVRLTCQSVATARRELKDIMKLVDTALAGHHPQKAILTLATRQLERFDIITIGICLLNNLVACAIDIESRGALLADNIRLIREVLDAADVDSVEGPFGVTQMPLTLCAAWIASPDPELQAEIERALAKYRFSVSSMPGIEGYVSKLQRMKHDFYTRLGMDPADMTSPTTYRAMDLAHRDPHPVLPQSAAGQAVSLGRGITYVKQDERRVAVSLRLNS
ncbi:hypothetical protein LTR78_009304 [Recurvomyces mirabilis]|uniref:Uncharacterized protein n=1 Tax=Recurvomyces mirabilis TaxID=574656 RepID=A0AAE0TNM6_9PEZI|nr:hypothetical protein LTR78_009304 [Recurvomyces mirabilis]